MRLRLSKVASLMSGAYREDEKLQLRDEVGWIWTGVYYVLELYPEAQGKTNSR